MLRCTLPIDSTSPRLARRCLLSRRRRDHHAEQITPPAIADRSDLFRRILLGAVTALVVARPLAAGEDPGRLHSPEGVSGTILNLLWLFTGLAGTAWLARSRRPMRLGGWTPLALWVAAGSLLLSTAVVPSYRHPGWLIAWEWATLAIVFILVRAIASDADAASDSSGGILAAIMASVVSLAVIGIYQGIANAANLPAPETIADPATVQPPDAGFLGPLSPASTRWIVRATFQRSDTFAALLLLAIPLVCAFGWRGRSWRSRLALGLAAMLAVALALSLRDVVTADLPKRLSDGVRTAGRMIAERPLFGVGPGNFDRHSPRLQATDLPAVLTESGNAYLDLFATGGVMVLVAVLAALALMVSAIRRQPAEETLQPEPALEQPAEPRWEFYLGGVAGLLLGLILRLADRSGASEPGTILHLGGVAVVRALVWFLSFALFEGVPWAGPMRCRAILVGVVLVALFGLVSGAALLPAVMQTMLALVAVAVSGRVTEVVRDPRSPARWVPVFLVAAVSLVYLFLVCRPTYESAAYTSEARREERLFPIFFGRAEGAQGDQRGVEMDRVQALLEKKILPSLNEASRSDPYDVAGPLEWAAWYHAYWKLRPGKPQEEGLAATGLAARIDPFGTAPLAAELQLRLTYMRLGPEHFHARKGAARTDPKDMERQVLAIRESNYREAESLVRRIAERDPALETWTRFRLAQTLVQLRDPERYKQGITEAARVWQLEENAPGPRWRLARDQRRLVRQWLKLPPEDGEWWVLLNPDAGPLGGGWVVVPILGPESRPGR